MKNKKPTKRILPAWLITVSLFVMPSSAGESQSEKAKQAWNPFFSRFVAAMKKRDRKSLREMMVSDIHFSGGGGDDNHNGDTRDEAFQFWKETRAWSAIEKMLSEGTVPMSRWWNNGNPHKYPCRVAPPVANRKGNRSYDFYAIFEFRKDGKWYCVILNQCCD